MKDAILPLMAKENVEIVRRVWEEWNVGTEPSTGRASTSSGSVARPTITAGAMNATR
jgi:hypothetical protein